MTHEGPMRGRKRTGGFTLVELAVSSVLVAIGLLAVFALLRRGMDTEEFSEEEIHETLFTENALATLRAAAEHASATGTWTNFWAEFEAGTTNIPLPGATPDSSLPDLGASASLSGARPVPFLVGGDSGAWRAALFAEWPRPDDGSHAVSNVVWYNVYVAAWDDSFAQIQIHLLADRPRDSSRTAFTLIPNQNGRTFLRPIRKDGKGRDETEELLDP